MRTKTTGVAVVEPGVVDYGAFLDICGGASRPNGAPVAAMMRVLAVTAMLFLGACGAPRGSTANSLHFDVGADPATLNPVLAHADAGNVEQELAHLAFEPFFDLDARGRLVPELVTEVPSVGNGGISRDGRTIIYHLRPGIVWSDGRAVTARDVLFTLHAILDPHQPVLSREGYELIDRADAPDPHTVRFHLSRPWAPAVATFFSYGTAPQYVMPAHVPLVPEPRVGDGPFLLESWKRGDRLVYRANPRYWRGRPQIDELQIAIVPDPNTNLTLLRSGAIGFNLIAPAQLPSLAGLGDLRYARVPTTIVAGLAFNLKHPPFDDVRVRRAVALSIDRAAISRKIALGVYPVADSDRPRFSWAYDSAVEEPRYDPAAADRLFDASGWRRAADGRRRKDGRPLEFTYVQFPESATGVRVAAFVQRELSERGVDATIKQISAAQFYLPSTGILAGGNFDLAYVPWTMGADPDDRFLIACDGTANYMRYCNRRVDALERAAAAEPERARRRSDYAAIDREVAGDVPILYLFNAAYVYAYDKRLHGFSPNAFSPTWNAYAWRLER